MWHEETSWLPSGIIVKWESVLQLHIYIIFEFWTLNKFCIHECSVFTVFGRHIFRIYFFSFSFSRCIFCLTSRFVVKDTVYVLRALTMYELRSSIIYANFHTYKYGRVHQETFFLFLNFTGDWNSVVFFSFFLFLSNWNANTT